MINAKYAIKKWDNFIEKREGGMVLEKLDFLPDNGNTDTYVTYLLREVK